MALYLTNISLMHANRTMSNVTSQLDTVYKRLSSGFRINSAKDDPAGFQIANRLTSQINGYKQGPEMQMTVLLLHSVWKEL